MGGALKMYLQKKGGYVCAAKLCTNKRYNCNLSFFKFPSNVELARTWAHACGRKDLIEKLVEGKHHSYRLCCEHFERKMFSNLNQTRVLKQAVPTLFKIKKSDAQDFERPVRFAPHHNENIVTDIPLNIQVMSNKSSNRKISEIPGTSKSECYSQTSSGSSRSIEVGPFQQEFMRKVEMDLVPVQAGGAKESKRRSRVLVPSISLTLECEESATARGTNTSSTCSSCLQVGNQLTTICSDDGSNSNFELYGLVQALADPDIWLDDDTFSICSACVATLRKTLDFRIQLRSAQKFFAFNKLNASNDSVNAGDGSTSSNMKLNSSTPIDSEIKHVFVKMEFDEDGEEIYDVPETTTESDLLNCIAESAEQNKQEYPVVLENYNSCTDVKLIQSSLADSKSSQIVPEPSLVQTIKHEKDEHAGGCSDLTLNPCFPESISTSPVIREVVQSYCTVVGPAFGSNSTSQYDGCQGDGKSDVTLKKLTLEIVNRCSADELSS